MRLRTGIAAAATAAAVLVSGGVAFAQEDSQQKPRRHRVVRATVHSDSIVVERDGTVHNVVMDLGRVTAVDAQRKAFQLARRDKVEITVFVQDDTKIRENGEQAEFGDIGIGDRVRTLAEKTGSDVHTLIVKLLPANSTEGQASA